MDNKKKFTPNPNNKQLENNDLKEIKELLKKMLENLDKMAENLNVMKDILDTRKRISPDCSCQHRTALQNADSNRNHSHPLFQRGRQDMAPPADPFP